jgi:hypothetical protein
MPIETGLQKNPVIHFQDPPQQTRIFLANRTLAVFHHGKVPLRYPGQLGKAGLSHALLVPRSQQGNPRKVFFPVFGEGFSPGDRIVRVNMDFVVLCLLRMRISFGFKEKKGVDIFLTFDLKYD